MRAARCWSNPRFFREVGTESLEPAAASVDQLVEPRLSWLYGRLVDRRRRAWRRHRRTRIRSRWTITKFVVDAGRAQSSR